MNLEMVNWTAFDDLYVYNNIYVNVSIKKCFDMNLAILSHLKCAFFYLLL